MAPHDFYDFGLRQPGLGFDIIETGLVVPRHSDNFGCRQNAFVLARCGGNKIIGESSFGHGVYTQDLPKESTSRLWKCCARLARATARQMREMRA